MLPLEAQRLALLDPEPVLLVDDDEPEVGERDGVADERVRADDDARLAGRGAQQRLPALGGGQLAR